MKKLICIFLTLVFAFSFSACGKDATTTADNGDTVKTATTVAADSGYLTGKHHVVMKIKDYGDVKLELDADEAPITVTNFIDLANEGFYDGISFHRFVDDFVLQGGDPLGTGSGGSSRKIKGEFIANGVSNNIKHTRGVISMARANDYNSASSQFFIVLDTSSTVSSSLDGLYAAFGYVTEGMDVIDAVCADAIVNDYSSGLISTDSRACIETIEVIE